MVTVCAPARPTWRPNRPATMAPSSGASTMTSRWVVESSIDRLPLEQIDVGDVDRAPVAEQRYQDRQSDRRLCGRNGEDEEHENLPRRLAELAREGDEVDVDREQHQLDRHQQDDDVLAVQEDAGHGDAEQHRAKRQEMPEGQPLAHETHALPSPAGAWPSAGTSRVLRVASASMPTMRSRSAASVRDWSPGFWRFTPWRWRSVSTTAAMTATVRINAAISNGSR